MNDFTVLSRRKTGRHLYCQDYHKVICGEDYVTVLVADGHGGAPYCRSSLGARFAVFAANKLLSSGISIDKFPEALKDEFDRLVDKHLAFHPLSEAEIKLHTEEESKTHRKVSPAESYGTTLLGIRITSEGMTEGFQLGDGEIHFTDRNGKFINFLDNDRDCYLNYTSSLCQDREYVINHFRTAVLNELPYAITLYTDGYKTDSPHPWEAVGLTLQDITEEKLDAVLDKHHSLDDRTFVMVYDNTLSKDENFAKRMTKTVEELAESEKMQKIKKLLEDEYNRLISYLKIVKAKESKFRDRESQEYKEFAAKIKPRVERFNAIKNLLDQMP